MGTGMDATMQKFLAAVFGMGMIVGYFVGVILIHVFHW